MSELLDFLNVKSYHLGTEISVVIFQSGVLAFILSTLNALLAYRAAIRKQSALLFWLGTFSIAYAVWNVLYLSSYTQQDIPLPSTTLTVEVTSRAHLMLGLLLPYFAHKFLSLFFGQKRFLPRLAVFSFFGMILLLFFPLENYYGLALIGSGFFIFGAFSLLTWKVWHLYRTTDDLKLKTRSFFVWLGLLVCTIFSTLGAIRAENLFRAFPVPYLGNILTPVLLYFILQMALNPRLREVRELMLRGIRVLLLTVILSVIFLSLLAWVGQNDWELFVFNTFIASFLILSILEPLRKKLDVFFLKQFIVDRYEFEELLTKLPRKLRAARNLDALAAALVNGIRESGRIYQTALFLWDPISRDFRLVPPSNLTFKNTLPFDDPFVIYFRENQHPLLLEQDQDLPEEVREALKTLHCHLALPLLRGEELLGVWALRSSFASTNPYTSFSNEEVELLEQVSVELVSILDQLQHFESQDRQERLAALGEMSAALAHEIRNPLGAIQGATQLLKTSPTLANSEDRECVDILNKEIDRMQRTVDQYLSFARKTEEPSTVSLETLIKAVLQSVQDKARKTKTDLHLEMLEPVPEIKTDPLKVEQVLFNLIQNACEAFSKNVWAKVSMNRQSEKPMIQIDVVDDGPGISPNNLNNIFNPLFTTKKAGSGIGLAICRKIIESLAGQISVRSTVGKGTTFRILLPVEGMRNVVGVQAISQPALTSAS